MATTSNVKMPVIGERIDTYGELKQAVQLWADRDDAEFCDEIPVFIDFAQRELYRLLKLPIQEKETCLEVTDGWAYIPSDFVSGKYMRLAGNPWLSVRESTFDEVRMLNGSDPNANLTGVKEIVFCSIGPRFAFYPQSLNCPLATENPDGSLNYTGAEMIVDYICDPEPMNADSDQSALLSIAPEAFLYGALKHSAYFTQNEDMQKKWEQLEVNAVKEIVEQNKTTRLGFNGLVVPRSNVNTFF